jgi:hypothetical protein
MRDRNARTVRIGVQIVNASRLRTAVVDSGRTSHTPGVMIRRIRSTRGAHGLLLVLTLSVVSACGSGARQTGARHAPAPASGAPSASSAGLESPSRVVTAITSATARARAQRRPRPPVIRAGRTIRSFSGTGNQAVGSLAEKSSIVLQWRTSGQRFQVFTARGFLLLDTHAATGRLRLARGEYSKLRVASPAGWTLLLRASA